MLLLLHSAHVLVIAWLQDVRKRCIHHVHTWWHFFIISVRFIMYRTFVPRIGLRAITEYSLPFVQCACATRFAYYFTTPVVVVATATHNHGVAASAVAGTGCFCCCYPYFVFARATRLFILLLLLLLPL